MTLAGFPGASFNSLGTWGLFIVAVIWMIRTYPRIRELQNNADGSLRHDLMERIDKLEAQLATERRECDTQLAGLRGEMRQMQTTIDALHRQLIEHSARAALQLPANSAPHAQAAAGRILGEAGE